ncbi:hypothetical protein ACFLT8_01975 [Chloroflexota bacterium]
MLIVNPSENIYKVRRIWYSALVIWGIIVLLWLIFLPFWVNFVGFLNSNGDIVDFSQKAMVILIAPYILLALNIVTDSVFYVVGKTQ